MIVVSDTTPLISLLKINCIDLLENLQRAGRHIGQRHYQMLLSRLKD